MSKEKHQIIIPLGFLETGLELTLTAKGPAQLFEQKDALEHGEALYQIIEGHTYEFLFSDNKYTFADLKEVISFSSVEGLGWIAPNIFVGTLALQIVCNETETLHDFKLEVRSKKTSYRTDYQFMLNDITGRATDLLLMQNSPVTQNFTIDPEIQSSTLYQRFAFIKSILDSEEFTEAVHRICQRPVTKWKTETALRNTSGIKRFGRSELRQIASGGNRVKLSDDHPLRNILESVPAKIQSSHKQETEDTAENRFIKYALEQFLLFCNEFRSKSKPGSRVYNESKLLTEKVESYLQHSLFKSVSNPSILKLNSPVLQRKEGYREMLRVWLMFDLAAKLIWKGGDDVYGAGKRDVAILYEYWLFFQLLDAVKSEFGLDDSSVSQLIEQTEHGMSLKLRQGKYVAVSGVYDKGLRPLEVRFSFNKVFSGGADYPAAGSWTKPMRPDYTLSLWPFGMAETEAEEQEMITHVHFDAKYKIDHFYLDKKKQKNENLTSEEKALMEQAELQKEEEAEIKGTFKNVDLLKMHAYKDAIRRTAGAYIIYPGSTTYPRKGFREILPGLGAFTVKPSMTNTGISKVKQFMGDIRDHIMNRASQRDQLNAKIYSIHKNKETILNVQLPEFDHTNERLLPDNITVLVGYYKTKKHLKWCEEKQLYNFRAGSGPGALSLTPEIVGARYVLLHSKDELTSELWEITGFPKLYSKKELKDAKYPSVPSQETYIVMEIRRPEIPLLQNCRWDVSKLKGYEATKYAYPFSVNLSEVVRKRIED